MKEKSYSKPEIKKEETNKDIFKKMLFSFREKIQQEPELEFLQDFFKEFPDSNIYLVGGMVRDAALGLKKMAKDFDFVVNNINLDQLITFLKQRGTVDLVGRNFGVLKFMPEDSKLTEAIDIALPRKESAGGSGGYRDFTVQSDPKLKIEDDLSRRDFTINSLALDIKSRQIIDPFGGLADLDKKIVKAVLNPQERFNEDYSRMLRALRFATKFNFQIETKTWQAICELAPQINKTRTIKGRKERIIPTETIAKEFLETLESDPLKCLQLYEQSGFLQELIPELLELQQCEQPKKFHSEGNVWEHTLLALQTATSEKFKKEFGQKAPLEVLLAILLHDIAKPQTAKYQGKQNRTMFIHHEKTGAEKTREICDRLTLPSYNGKIKTENIFYLVNNHMVSKAETPKEIKATKLEKIFFKDPQLGQKLIMVCYCDDQASIGIDGKPNLKGYEILKNRLEELKTLGSDEEMPKSIINGKQLMEEFNLQPGPQIGDLLNFIREAQLNGEIDSPKEAMDLAAKKLNK